MANNRTVVAIRFFIALWLLAHATPVVANDAGLELPSGGSWRPMKEHPSVRLAAERISIRLLATEAIIDVTAHYENKGPACSIKMGFPEREVGWADPGTFAKSFRSSVDDQPVKVTPSEWREEDGLRMRWWIKDVSFAANQKRLVRVRYQFAYGIPPIIEYILHTGASWRGPIASLLVEIDTGSFGPDAIELNLNDRFARRGRKLVWREKSFEPAASDNLTIQIIARPTSSVRHLGGGRCEPMPRKDAPCVEGEGFCVISWGEPGGWSSALWCREGRWTMEDERNLSK
jgi:hypothetical protein